MVAVVMDLVSNKESGVLLRIGTYGYMVELPWHHRETKLQIEKINLTR
jgi:hypothetical protein